jgi:hypothetical protein
MEQTVFNSNIENKSSSSDNLNSLVEINKFDRVNSYDTISTHESKTIDDDLESIIEDLLEGKKSLADVPEAVLKYTDEINKLPERPRRPENWECCGSGCCPCIWDIYDRDLEIHERSVQTLCEKVRGDTDFPEK